MFETETMTIVAMGSIGLLSILFGDAVVQQVRAILPRPCRLIRSFFFPDRCAGACGRGRVCVAVDFRPFFFRLRQAKKCACVPIPPVPGGGAGGGQ